MMQLQDYNIYALENNVNLGQFKNINVVKGLPNNLSKFFDEKNIQYVIHLATNSERNNQVEVIEDIVRTNIELGLNILNASAKSNVKKIISAGSYSQNVTLLPLNAYTISKNYFEDLQRFFSIKHALGNVSIHFGDIYGPSDKRNKLIPYMRKHEDDNLITFESDGKGLFSPVFINDAVKSIIVELEKDNKDFFIVKTVASELMSVVDFVTKYKEIREKQFEVLFTKQIVNRYSSTQNFKPSKKLNYELQRGLKLI